MSKRPVIGTCHICGVREKMSYEHIPPKKAFNNRRVMRVGFDDVVNLGPDEFPRGPIQQQGAGAYTLCESCNTKTGHWYGKAFVNWCYQGADVLIRTGFEPSIFTLHYLLPLRVIKQVVTMFFSVNSDGFRKANPYLEEFVLNPKKRYLPSKYGIFVYFNCGRSTDRFRYNGISAIVRTGNQESFDNKGIITLSEITFPPFGYVMTLDSDPPDRRLLPITHFANYGYNDFKVLELRPPVLDTPTYFPGDYRTPKEFCEQVTEAEATIHTRNVGTGNN